MVKIFQVIVAAAFASTVQAIGLGKAAKLLLIKDPKKFFSGILPSGGGKATAGLAIPTSPKKAIDDGWVQVDQSDWYSNPLLPFHSVRYEKKKVTAIKVTSIASPTAEGDLYDVEDGDKASLTVEFFRFGKRMLVSVNGVFLPGSAKIAEELGWIEGGCIGFMGGSHYYRLGIDNDWTTEMPVVPIYDRHGTGELRTVILAFGAVDFGSLGVSSQGFDLGGASVNPIFNCNFNFCGNEECLLEANTFLSNNGWDAPDDPSTASPVELSNNFVHIMLFNPADDDQHATCQAKFGECETDLCSCCTSEDGEGFVPRDERMCVFPNSLPVPFPPE